MKVLILCTGNSCRSQMAQAFLQTLDARLHVRSAGTRPASEVNSIAVKVMEEVGLRIGHNIPRSVNDYLAEPWDYVITVCGGANESCPTFQGKVEHRLHIGFDDPAAATGTEAEVLAVFRRVRNEIEVRFRQFYEEELTKQL